MDDLLDSFDELSGRERSRRAGYRFPDNSSHPLSSYSQRGPNLAGLQSTHDLERSKILYESAQAKTQQLAQIRDAQAGLYEAEQRNRILEHSNAAFDLLKSADPNDPSFEQVALEINKNHARAFQDPALKQAFDYANGIYTRGVKADQDAKKTEVTHQNALDRSTFAEELRQVRGLGSDYRQMANARLAELGPEASFADRQSVLDEIRVKADEAGRYAKLTEAGLPWEARRAGDRSQDQLIDQNTGMLDRAKADSWLRDATSSREKVSAAKTFFDIARKKDPVTDAQWFSDNADMLREAEGIIASGFSSGTRKPVEDRAWAAVAGPTRELERLNQQVKAEPDPKKREAIFNQMRPLVAQRDEAAKAHPGFNTVPVAEDGETESQMRNRLEDTAQVLLRWPIGAPITVNGKSYDSWDTKAKNALLAQMAGLAKGSAQPTAKGEPNAAEAPAVAPAPAESKDAVAEEQRKQAADSVKAQMESVAPRDVMMGSEIDERVRSANRWVDDKIRAGAGAVWGAAKGVAEGVVKKGQREGYLNEQFARWKQSYLKDLLTGGGSLPPEKSAGYEAVLLDIAESAGPDSLTDRRFNAPLASAAENARFREALERRLKAREEQLTADRKK